jgi:hypothetical protein
VARVSTEYRPGTSTPTTQPAAWVKANVSVVGSLLALAGTLAVGLAQGARPFYPDSGEYWALANSFTRHGSFSLANFESPTRGYLFPLVTFLIKGLAQVAHLRSWVVVTVFMAILFALIGTVLAPSLVALAWPERRWGFIPRLLLTALLLIFWGGDLNYPMTDFPALAVALLALLAMARPDSWRWMLVAGAASAAALELRPSYVLLAPMVLLIVGLTWFDQRKGAHATGARRAFCLVALVTGFAVVVLPQSLATHHHYGTWSFIPGAVAHLEEEQLSQGMVYQRYDTYDPAGRPAAIIYRDRTGQHLLEQQPSARISDVEEYLSLYLTNPEVMIGAAVRHIVNGMDVRYNTMFVEHRDSGGRSWLRIGGFLLTFLALVRLLWPRARRSLGRVRWRYPIALALCSLTAVPSTTETRYLLSIYLLGYLLVLSPGWPSPIGQGKGLRRLGAMPAIAACCVVFTAIVWHEVGGVKGRVGTMKYLPQVDPREPWLFTWES